jgi:hypothetical protein
MIEITNLTEGSRAQSLGFAVGRNKDETAIVESVEAGETKRLPLNPDNAVVVARRDAGLISVKQVREQAETKPRAKPE